MPGFVKYPGKQAIRLHQWLIRPLDQAIYDITEVHADFPG